MQQAKIFTLSGDRLMQWIRVCNSKLDIPFSIPTRTVFSFISKKKIIVKYELVIKESIDILMSDKDKILSLY